MSHSNAYVRKGVPSNTAENS